MYCMRSGCGESGGNVSTACVTGERERVHNSNSLTQGVTITLRSVTNIITVQL